MAPLPTPSPSTPSPSGAPTRQIMRSSLPTPTTSRIVPTEPTEQQSSSSTSSRLPSPQSKSRTSREGTPSDTDNARMPPPARTTRSAAAAAAAGGKERTVVRRTVGTRDLKEKEKSDKEKSDEEKKVVPKRSMSLRSGTKRTSITSRTGGQKKEESTALPKRSLRTRTTSTSTNASAPTERKMAASTAASSRIAAAPRTLRERSGTATAVVTATTTSRRPVSMNVEYTSATSTGPRRAAAPASTPAAAPARTHRRNQSTPSAPTVQPPVRPGTSASTASNISKSRRPPFSTLQQNFAAPAPPPTSRRSMPPPPLDTATVHQQTQLLQHSCLYANSHSTYAQLTASATAKLKRRFDTLAREHSKSREQLARRQRLLDIAGLVAVVETPAAGITGKRRETMRSPEEKIQAFSEAIKKLESLQQNEHRLLSSAFGEWIAGYSPPSPRRGIEQGGWVKKRGRWIDGLGEDWRRQCLFTSRRIEAAVKAIESVVAAVVMEEELGVVSVVSERWMEVAKGMLEESQGMMLVEGNVVQRERRALEEVVAGAASVDNVIDDAVSEAEDRPVWA